jgi:hypothetical protein
VIDARVCRNSIAGDGTARYRKRLGLRTLHRAETDVAVHPHDRTLRSIAAEEFCLNVGDGAQLRPCCQRTVETAGQPPKAQRLVPAFIGYGVEPLRRRLC